MSSRSKQANRDGIDLAAEPAVWSLLMDGRPAPEWMKEIRQMLLKMPVDDSYKEMASSLLAIFAQYLHASGYVVIKVEP